MTKHAATCKNMADGHEQEDVEEEATALGSNARTVRKFIGETPDMQSVREVTEAVMEERRVEEIPLSTQEQVPQCLSTERHEMTGEVAEEPPQDHESDLEESEDEENSLEASQRADRLEFIREFQEIMNKAIEQLLNKPVRRHSCRKNKPEPCMEYKKCKETICKEAERLPQHNINRESDDE